MGALVLFLDILPPPLPRPPSQSHPSLPLRYSSPSSSYSFPWPRRLNDPVPKGRRTAKRRNSENHAAANAEAKSKRNLDRNRAASIRSPAGSGQQSVAMLRKDARKRKRKDSRPPCSRRKKKGAAQETPGNAPGVPPRRRLRTKGPAPARPEAASEVAGTGEFDPNAAVRDSARAVIRRAGERLRASGGGKVGGALAAAARGWI